MSSIAPRRSQRASTSKSSTSSAVLADDIDDDFDEQPDIPEPKKAKGRASNKGKGASGKKRKNDEANEKHGRDVPKSPEKRLKSVLVKGKAPVDAECSIASKCHVFYDEEGVWDCMLSQTSIQNNSNKYYLIQLLQEDGSNRYHVWMRWGRVGYKGQVSLSGCQSNLAQAKKIFEKKFLDKTKNSWGERTGFEKWPNKYDLVLMDYNAEEAAEKAKGDEVDASRKKPIKTPESTLQQAVQDLVKLVCDISTMEQTMIEMQYDTKKAPLGKLTNEQIKAGYQALKRISELITASKKSELLEACNDFYTRIPHEFGMRPPPLIRSLAEVKVKIQLLEALGDIRVALKILNDKVDVAMNPVDRHYKQLGCDISHLEKDSEDYKLVAEYIQTTHAKTHSMYTMDIQDIFECRKEAEMNGFKDKGNRTLLFHGSRMSNWAGILGQGLKIAPPEAPVTGYMFGKGVYFADMSSKSANYCWTTPSKDVGLLLMCEVALGKPNELVNGCYTADELPKGTDSVKGLGQVAPDPLKAKKLSDGTLVPIGPSVNTNVNNPAGYTLNYNEYIVYDTAQIKMRYLAKIKFNYYK